MHINKHNESLIIDYNLLLINSKIHKYTYTVKIPYYNELPFNENVYITNYF